MSNSIWGVTCPLEYWYPSYWVDPSTRLRTPRMILTPTSKRCSTTEHILFGLFWAQLSRSWALIVRVEGKEQGTPRSRSGTSTPLTGRCWRPRWSGWPPKPAFLDVMDRFVYPHHATTVIVQCHFGIELSMKSKVISVLVKREAALRTLNGVKFYPGLGLFDYGYCTAGGVRPPHQVIFCLSFKLPNIVF